MSIINLVRGVLSLMVAACAATAAQASATKGIVQADRDAAAKQQVQPEKLWGDIVGNGWPALMEPFVTKFQPGRSYLALIKKFPARTIDTRTPNRFKDSLGIENVSAYHVLGHMAFGWSCAGAAGNQSGRGFASMTGEFNQQLSKMVQHGWGLNSVLATFTDGQLQDGAVLHEYFSSAPAAPSRMKSPAAPAPSFALVVEVGDDECRQVEAFAKAFVHHPSRPWSRFGLLADPASFEGGVCGSFAITALSRSNTLGPIVSTYWRTLPVTENLIGKRTKIHLPKDTLPYSFAEAGSSESPVGPAQLYLADWNAGKTEVVVRFADPELTIFSFRVLADIAARQPSTGQISHQQATALATTRRRTAGDPTGEELDAGFDGKFSQVSATVQEWWASRQDSHRIEVVDLPIGAGILVSLQP